MYTYYSYWKNVRSLKLIYDYMFRKSTNRFRFKPKAIIQKQ